LHDIVNSDIINVDFAAPNSEGQYGLVLFVMKLTKWVEELK